MDSSQKSKLEHGRQRFLAYAIEHALEIGRRTPEDFIRHFPPKTIMQALSLRPDLRASLLVPTTGLKHRIALKKTWQSAGDDLQSALDEGETKPVQIVQAFAPDDRVLYLEDKKLWAFIVEGQFWKVTAKDQAAFAIAQQHIAYLLDRALIDGLITSRDVIDAIGVGELCNRLPRSEMASLFTAALERGRSGTAFTDKDLLAALPPSTLVQHVPLPHIFETILHTRVAKVHGYLPEEPKPEEPKRDESKPADVSAAVTSPAPELPKDAQAEATPAAAAHEKAEPKTNGSRRRTNPPAAGSGETPAALSPEDETEWIEMPDSTH
jgi:hypothetical protein